MWALIILASCGPGVVEVAPAAGEKLPPNPTIFVTLVDPAKLRFEDAKGNELSFTSQRLAGDFSSAVVQAPEGTEFFLVLPGLPRRGPWRVSKAGVDRTSPKIAAAEELAYENCTDSNGWTLTSDRAAPVWELELTSGGKRSTAFDAALFVGAHGCGRRTWSWSDEDVSVRARGRFFDGSVGEWSNAVVLSKPTPSLIAPLRNFLEGGGLDPLALISTFALLGTMAIGVVIAARRSKLNE